MFWSYFYLNYAWKSIASEANEEKLRKIDVLGIKNHTSAAVRGGAGCAPPPGSASVFYAWCFWNSRNIYVSTKLTLGVMVLKITTFSQKPVNHVHIVKVRPV